MNFVAVLLSQGLKQQTIKCYLSAVHHLQIECGVGDPRVESMPLLALMLQGAKQEQAGVPNADPSTTDAGSSRKAEKGFGTKMHETHDM